MLFTRAAREKESLDSILLFLLDHDEMRPACASTLSVRQLKAALGERGVSYAGVLEKSELLELFESSQSILDSSQDAMHLDKTHVSEQAGVKLDVARCSECARHRDSIKRTWHDSFDKHAWQQSTTPIAISAVAATALLLTLLVLLQIPRSDFGHHVFLPPAILPPWPRAPPRAMPSPQRPPSPARPPPPSPAQPPRPPPPIPPRPWQPPRPPAVVDEINARWQRGKPSNYLAEAGVLVHLFDNFEDWEHGRPWSLCEEARCQRPRDASHSSSAQHVDHLACSVVNQNAPAVFPGGSAEGLILSTEAHILCAYSKDVGSGFAVHGGCDTPPRYEGDWKAPRTLEEAMRGQSPRNYNEVCALATRHGLMVAHKPEP